MCFPATASDSKESSLCSIPREVLWNCLLRVPQSYHLNISCSSKNLRSLVRSPEFNRLLSLRNDSVYVSFAGTSTTHHWFTLRPIEKMKKIEYRLVPIPIPISLPCRFRSLATSVAVGSEIYFVGGFYRGPSSDLWIFDTRSGNLTQGPSMKVARRVGDYTVGVVDGKIYVIGGAEIQVEVFDPKSRSWNFQGEEEKFDCGSRFTALLEGKVYMLNSVGAEISAYDPNAREGRREEIKTKKRKREEGDLVKCVCVVENVLYACFAWSGLMWFDTKLKVWKRLVRCDGKALYPFSVSAMAEYNGKLAFFWPQRKIDGSEEEKDVMCGLVALDRVGHGIRGKVEWSGIVATIPYDYCLLHCLAVSD